MNIKEKMNRLEEIIEKKEYESIIKEYVKNSFKYDYSYRNIIFVSKNDISTDVLGKSEYLGQGEAIQVYGESCGRDMDSVFDIMQNKNGEEYVEIDGKIITSNNNIEKYFHNVYIDDYIYKNEKYIENDIKEYIRTAINDISYLNY